METQTHSEIVAADSAERNRRQKAFVKERAVNDHAMAVKKVKALESASTLVEEQLRTIEQLAKLAVDVPDDITTRQGFVAKEMLAECLTDLQRGLQTRADKAHKEILDLRTVKIPRLKKQAESI
jgi:hypothetical protein